MSLPSQEKRKTQRILLKFNKIMGKENTKKNQAKKVQNNLLNILLNNKISKNNNQFLIDQK